MKKLITVLLTLGMLMAFAMPAMAEEATEPKLWSDANTMTYYVGGYGTVPTRYQCCVDFADYGTGEWFEISYGDPLVAEWPTETGTYTVSFDTTATIEGTEYPFTIDMNVIVLELPETSGKCGDNMIWNLDIETDTLTISGTGDMYTVVDGLEWEDEILWEPDWWRNNCVKHIVIEDGVERLSNFAFRHNFYVESIQLPSTLKEFPELGLFVSDHAIEELIIPEGITSITGWPFGSPGNTFMSVKELYLPSTLTEIDLVALALGCVQSVEDGFAFEGLTVHYAGTQEQWDAIRRIKSDFFVEQGLENFYNSFAENLPSFEAAVVFEPKQEDEDITVDNGNASIPDSKVEIADGKDVVIDVTATETEETVTGAVIGAATVEKLADANASVEIKLPDATVNFDAAAMGTIAGAATDKPITIVAKETKQETLTTEQKATLAELNVATVLSLEVLVGDTKVSDFGGGKATITVPFELPEGEDGDKYYVAYIAADGTVTAMPTTYANGALTFTTPHFSEYAVLEKSAIEDVPPLGDGTNILLITLLMVAAGVGLVVCATKRRAF